MRTIAEIEAELARVAEPDAKVMTALHTIREVPLAKLDVQQRFMCSLFVCSIQAVKELQERNHLREMWQLLNQLEQYGIIIQRLGTPHGELFAFVGAEILGTAKRIDALNGELIDAGGTPHYVHPETPHTGVVH